MHRLIFAFLSELEKMFFADYLTEMYDMRYFMVVQSLQIDLINATTALCQDVISSCHLLNLSSSLYFCNRKNKLYPESMHVTSIKDF